MSLSRVSYFLSTDMSTESSTPAELTEELTKERVRSHRDDVIQQGFSTSEIALIEALPASGKSYGVLQWGGQKRIIK